MRHVTFCARKLHAQVGGVLLLPGLVRMALFAFEINSLFASLAELDDAFMRIMAEDAFKDGMFALEKVANFYTVLDEPILGSYRCT